MFALSSYNFSNIILNFLKLISKSNFTQVHSMLWKWRIMEKYCKPLRDITKVNTSLDNVAPKFLSMGQ